MLGGKGEEDRAVGPARAGEASRRGYARSRANGQQTKALAPLPDTRSVLASDCGVERLGVDGRSAAESDASRLNRRIHKVRQRRGQDTPGADQESRA